MKSILLRALSLTLVILIGIIMRKTRVADQYAGAFVKKILMNITLPATIIINFSKIKNIDKSMIIIILFGIVANFIMIFVGFLATLKKSKAEKALFMNCLPAYNIGAFCLPFVQNFLPAAGNVAACLFDAGNSIMCTGGTYSINAEYLSETKEGFSIRNFIARLVTSPPLLTYIFMIILSLIHVELPDFVFTLLSPAASANPFMAMLMIGLLFRIEFNKSYFSLIFRMLLYRHIFALAVSLFYYFILPFDLIIRQALVLVSFGPMSVISPVFTSRCGGDEGIASAANSISIILSIIEITILLLAMGIS